MEGRGLTYFSRCLATLGPQPPHGRAKRCRFPWSEWFDRIFRNEGAAGSNPASSTKRPGQGHFGWLESLPAGTFSRSLAPWVPHMTKPVKHLIFCEGVNVEWLES